MTAPARHRSHAVLVPRLCAFALVAAALGGCVVSVRAQDLPAGRGLTLATTLDTAVTVSEGGQTTTSSIGASRQDVALQVRPGVQLSSRSGRVQGTLSYSADLTQHSRRADSSNWQNFLDARARAQALEGVAYVDVTANINQTSLSPFGRQSVDGSLANNANRTEVGRLSITPVVEGRLGSVATVEVRGNASATNTRDSLAADSTSTGGSVSLASASRGSVFGWGLVGSHSRTDFRAGRTTETNRAVLSLSATPDPDLRLTLRGGQEQTNSTSLERKSFDNYGGQLQWLPTERTVVDINADKRFFGNSRQVRVTHRFPLSSFSYTSSRDVTNGADAGGIGQQITLLQLVMFLLIETEPDPVRREQLARDRIAQLGLDPNSLQGGGFVNNGITVLQRDDASWIYNGRRLSLMAQGYRTTSRTIGGTQANTTDEPVRQTGYTGTATWRLTPTASANVTGSRQMTKSTSVQAGTDLKSLSIGWTDLLGRRTSASLSARYSVFNSSTDPYRETAVRASLAMRF